MWSCVPKAGLTYYAFRGKHVNAEDKHWEDACSWGYEHDGMCQRN